MDQKMSDLIKSLWTIVSIIGAVCAAGILAIILLGILRGIINAFKGERGGNGK